MMCAPELFPILLKIHENAAVEMAPDGGHLHCNECGTNGANLGVKQIAKYLREGWPDCCETQMRLVVNKPVANDDHPVRDHDAEIGAIQVCVKALDELGGEAQLRIVHYLSRRFPVDPDLLTGVRKAAD